MNTRAERHNSLLAELALFPILQKEAAPLVCGGGLLALAFRVKAERGTHQTAAEEMKANREEGGAVWAGPGNGAKGDERAETLARPVSSEPRPSFSRRPGMSIGCSWHSS